MLYFAYGSNLDKYQMARRCPKAVPLKAIALDKFKLVFKYFADIEACEENIIHGGLWNITKECERFLDKYEGVEKNLYSKKYFKYHGESVLYYKMNDNVIYRPSYDYAIILRKGYDDFSLPVKFLYEAINEALRFSKRYV